MKSKICGISDSKTLEHLVNYKYPPEFIGFIVNYPKSKRHVDIQKLKDLMKIEKKNSFYVAVLVNPNHNILEEIKDLPFDYYHQMLYLFLNHLNVHFLLNLRIYFQGSFLSFD